MACTAPPSIEGNCVVVQKSNESLTSIQSFKFVFVTAQLIEAVIGIDLTLLFQNNNNRKEYSRD